MANSSQLLILVTIGLALEIALITFLIALARTIGGRREIEGSDRVEEIDDDFPRDLPT